MDNLVRVRRLRMTKLAELAIFLLLLLNLKGFFGMVESVTTPVPVKKEAPLPIAKAKLHKAKKQAAALNANSENASTDPNLADQLVALVQQVAANFNLSSENSTNTTTANTPQPIAYTASVLDPANFYQQSGIIQFPIGQNLPIHQLEPVSIAGIPSFTPGLQTIKTPKNSPFYTVTFGIYDQNYVKDGDHSNNRSGFGGGLAVGYRKGKWGVETGVMYSQKNYKPALDKQEYSNDPTYGLSVYYTKEVDADVVSIPVKGTRQILKGRKTSAHAIAGVTAHFAVDKKYHYQTQHYPPIGSSDPITYNPNLAPLPEAKGVFENGGTQQNVYATADLGLRVERSMGKRYVAFVEPVYRQSLGGGFGPGAAKLSTFSVQAGVMASL